VLLAYPPGDIILAQLASPLNDVIFCLHQDQETYLSTNIGPEVVLLNIQVGLKLQNKVWTNSYRQGRPVLWTKPHAQLQLKVLPNS
jgi:hypothetical protein